MSRPVQAADLALLGRGYALFALGLVLFVVVLGVLERLGLSRDTLGYVFLATTVLVYAAIGILNRTNDATEYYVAGRRVPAAFSGMASAADWMSAASFLGLAGGLYLHGHSGLAFVIGWTGGFVLIAIFIAPYLRQFGQFTLPDFFGARYGGHIPRLAAALIAILCSFTYVVAQIYGVGLITMRLTQVPFEVGIWLGLGGVLVCSFLGGMKAVTWTQVAQYIVLVIAYLVPVVWLAGKQVGVPLAALFEAAPPARVAAVEPRPEADPKEQEVRRILAERAREAREHLRDPVTAWRSGRERREAAVAEARQRGEAQQLLQAELALSAWPPDEATAVIRWRGQANAGANLAPGANGTSGAGPPTAQPQASEASRRNFLALVFCLMVGTASLPHILMRYYTTANVREARRSVVWGLFFIFVLYFTAPSLAVLVRHEVYSDLVGTAFSSLPNWVPTWQQFDPTLLDLKDVNGDGIVQRAEILMGSDIVVLASPEIAGVPYVVSGLVAAGGLAAALSTADGLLLTISNSLAHDFYYKVLDPSAPAARRVMISKLLLLIVAALAALLAARRPADVLFMITAAFSLAAAGFFPALVLGIFWKRATGLGATLGMLAGLAVTLGYMVAHQPWLRQVFLGVPRAAPVDGLWWGIQPTAAGVFGVPVGFAVIALVSLMTSVPTRQTQELVDHLRFPGSRSLMP